MWRWGRLRQSANRVEFLSAPRFAAAAANVAAAGMAARAGRPIGFIAFLKIGLPVTLVSMLLATGYITVRYL